LVVGLLAKYGSIAAALVLFTLFAKRGAEVGIGPAATEVASSFGTFGMGLGAVGGGVQSLFTGIGTGIAQLFNPLFTLRDLVFGPQAGQQAAATAATQQPMMMIPPPSNEMTSPPLMMPPMMNPLPSQRVYTQAPKRVAYIQQQLASRNQAVYTRVKGLYAGQQVTLTPKGAQILRQRGLI